MQCSEYIIDGNATFRYCISRDLQQDIVRLVESYAPSQVNIVADERVIPLTEDISAGVFDCLSPHPVIPLKATEADKTMETVMRLCRTLAARGADRDSLLLAFGGGITTDIAGFAASIYKRGIRAAFIPTTLLAQVDASIGGKCGVNLDGIKNTLGTITQPLFALSHPGYLRTLPHEVLMEGVAEMLKTFIIGSGEHYRKTVSLFSRQWESDEDTLGELISRAVSIKASIVASDCREHGMRVLLNLGHTFAHAIETLSQGDEPHGLAVARGISLAARAACRKGIASDAFADMLTGDLHSLGFETRCPFTPSQMAKVMLMDKKMHSGHLELILPASLADVRRVRVEANELMEILTSL